MPYGGSLGALWVLMMGALWVPTGCPMGAHCAPYGCCGCSLCALWVLMMGAL